VGFEQPLPDFTDCDFASREPQADWVAVAHEGGPLRGFSTIMPAFGDALTREQLERVITYVASFCRDPSWPRGELNLPRPFNTEKAYPEDEAVLTAATTLDSGTPVDAKLVYERRFGHQSQVEISVPFASFPRTGPGEGGRASGIGDIALGLKRAMWHDPRRGSILSLGGEVKLPTGDEPSGLGGGETSVEAFVAFGQILPADGFLHVQAGAEGPFEVEETFLRLALGKTFLQGRGLGRAWSPMVEMLAVRDAADDEVLIDLVPQLQVSLSRRQHILASAGVGFPVTETTGRSPSLLLYILWDWFDGGFLDGW